MEHDGSSCNLCEEKAVGLSQSVETKAESPDSSKASALYPVLSEDSQTALLDCKTEQAASSASVTNSKPSSGVDSDTQVVPGGKSGGETVPSEQALDIESKKLSVNSAPTASVETPTKGDSLDDGEKKKRDDHAASPAATTGPSAETDSAPPTRGIATEGAEGSAPSTSETGLERGATGGKKSSQGESVYYVKWITFNNNNVPIITQNENGPCPLLAVVNVLLLKGKVRLAPIVEMITSEQLMAHLGDCVVESMPKVLRSGSLMMFTVTLSERLLSSLHSNLHHRKLH